MVDRLTPRLEIHPDPAATARALCDFLTDRLSRTVAASQVARLSLCGGSTPATTYGILAREWPRQRWASSLEVYWGDERFVPPTSPQSNYGLADATLLAGDWLAADHVHPIPTENARTPESAAAEYEATLRQAFGSSSSSFDVALLGMGPDGHTASLFPGEPAIGERERWVRSVADAPQPPHVARVTLTVPVLNRARAVVVLVTGTEKASIVRQALAPVCEGASPLPVAVVGGSEETHWFLDAAAAALVTP